MVNEASLITT